MSDIDHMLDDEKAQSFRHPGDKVLDRLNRDHWQKLAAKKARGASMRIHYPKRSIEVCMHHFQQRSTWANYGGATAEIISVYARNSSCSDCQANFIKAQEAKSCAPRIS